MPGLLALIVWRPSTKSPPTTPGALQSAACYPDRVRTSLGGIPVSAQSPSADAEATMAASSERRAAIWNERLVRTRPNFWGGRADCFCFLLQKETTGAERLICKGFPPGSVQRNLQKFAPSWLPGGRRGGVRYGSGGSELQRQDRPHSPACRGGRMLGRTRFRAGAAEKRHDGRIHVADERRVRWPVQMLWSPRPLYDDRGCPSSHDVPLQASRLRGPTTL